MFERDLVVGYFLLGPRDEILYVGITNDPDDREYQHRRDQGMRPFVDFQVVTGWMPRRVGRQWEVATLDELGGTLYNNTRGG